MPRWDDRRLLLTPRLRLEPLTPAHAEALFHGLADPRIYTYIPGQPPASVHEVRERFEAVHKGGSADGREAWLNWAVALHDGTYIGRLESTLHGNGLASVAYILFPDFWRHGYAREGMNAVLAYLAEPGRGVTRVRAEIDRRNARSIALIRALGFAPLMVRPPHLSADDDLYELTVEECDRTPDS